MLSGELYIAERAIHKHFAEGRLEIKNLHQGHRSRAHLRSWLSRQGRRLLCQLGHMLVALGERLQRYELSQPLSVEG